ncbi:MAG: hypothetical protein FK734_01850 [Asgard group archaeon]|nr:hypothetical protein [Asgard group archaeon]
MNKIKSTGLTSIIIINIPFKSKDIAESIDLSTSPENKEVPVGIIAKSKVTENNLELTIKSQTTLIDLLSTIEDYLEKIDLSYKTIEKTSKSN